MARVVPAGYNAAYSCGRLEALQLEMERFHMPGFHWPELIILVAIALLIFGPKRLPEMGASIGKTIKEFQKSMREVTEPEKPATPTTPAVLPQADAQVQVTPAVAAPSENTVASAPSASSASSAEATAE